MKSRMKIDVKDDCQYAGAPKSNAFNSSAYWIANLSQNWFASRVGWVDPIVVRPCLANKRILRYCFCYYMSQQNCNLYLSYLTLHMKSHDRPKSNSIQAGSFENPNGVHLASTQRQFGNDPTRLGVDLVVS